MWTVYKHTSPNGKVYIGITGRKVKKRWENGNGYRNNKYFTRAIKKYGWENFNHEILFEGLTKKQAGEMEQHLIEKYDCIMPKGYNKSKGGEYGALGVHPSAETRRKMSESHKGANSPWYGKHLSAETCQKLSESHKGKHLSSETRKKLSEANKGRKQTPQQRDALMNYLIGHEVSAETRQKLREANIGRTPWNKGKKASEEAKEKNRIAAIKLGKIPPYIKPTKVVCVETGEVFQQIKDAGEKYGICPANITAVCRHRRERAGGYHWKYAEDNH